MWVDMTPLRRSRLQQILWWLGLAVVAVLLLCSGLSWPFKVSALLGLVGLNLVHRHVQQRQIQLSKLQQHDRMRWQWQQATSSNRTSSNRTSTSSTQQRRQSSDTAQIQARLLRVEAWLGVVVILHFEVTALGRRQTWLLWRDQVDVENWRRLQVLQQYWSAKLD